MYMRSKFAIGLTLLFAASVFAQNRIDPQNSLHITLPDDSPLGLVQADWGESNATARGSAMLLDLHTSLVFKNSSQRRVRGVTLLVKAQEVTPGGKASVSVPSLNVNPGELFPIRIDLRLLRPLQTGNGPLVEVALDGILFDDLSFYGPNRLNSRRSLTVWEMEARRDRQHFMAALQTGGVEGLKQEMVASLNRQAERNGMEARVTQSGRASNFTAERNVQFAFLEVPGAPLDLSEGTVAVSGSQGLAPRISVRNRSNKQVRGMELGWLIKDSGGKEFVAGTIPLDVPLAPHQTTKVVQDGTFKFDRPNGRPINIDSMTAYVSSVEFADGNMWIPSRGSRIPTPSPEEHRLSELYRNKGVNALIEELKKY